MGFWDSSAIVPSPSRQTASTAVGDLLLEDDGVTVWWGTWVECAVAISRLKREGEPDEESEDRARTRLERLVGGWLEVEPTGTICDSWIL